MNRWMGIAGALLILGSIGCANPTTQKAPERSVQWAPETVVPQTMNMEGCPTMQEVAKNIPHQIPGAQADTMLTTIPQDQVQDSAPVNPDAMTYSTNQFRGRYGLGYRGLYYGSWFRPYRYWPGSISSFRFYNYRNLYYPYYYYPTTSAYYPAYYPYSSCCGSFAGAGLYGAGLYGGGCCGGAGLGVNYAYPFYYRSAGFYRPFYYHSRNLLWNRSLAF